MIDWTARANSILQKTPMTPTAKTDETPIPAVLAVQAEGVSEKTQEGFGSFGSTPPAPFAENVLPDEVERRLVRLLATGAIDAEDAALVRDRWHLYPAEWNLLLDACEAARAQRT